jgi:hypothetical protein
LAVEENANGKNRLSIDLTPKNNRKYKSRVSKCLKEFFVFFKQLEKVLKNNQEQNIRELYFSSLRPFLILFFTNTLKLKDFRKGDLSLKKLPGHKNYKEYGVIRYKDGSLLVSKNELILLYNTMQTLKQNLLDWLYINELEITKEEAEKKNITLPFTKPPDTDGHFIFMGKEIAIVNKLVLDSRKFESDNDISTDLGLSLSGTHISEKDFSRSAISAIRGEEFFETGSGLKIHNQQSLSFLVNCTTDFSWKLLNINATRPVRKCFPNKHVQDEALDPIFSVPCLFNVGFATFTELIQSLFVQYFVSFDDFQAVSLCDVCGSLMLREREKPKKIVDPFSRPIPEKETETVFRNYCSIGCSNRDPVTRTKERNEVYNCRNRQKQVYGSRFETTIPFYSSDCSDQCGYDLENLPEGGDCVHVEKKMDRIMKKMLK